MKNPWWSFSLLDSKTARLQLFSIKFHYPMYIIVGSIINFPIHSLLARMIIKAIGMQTETRHVNFNHFVQPLLYFGCLGDLDSLLWWIYRKWTRVNKFSFHKSRSWYIEEIVVSLFHRKQVPIIFICDFCHVFVCEHFLCGWFIIKTRLSYLAAVNVESVTQPVGKQHESSFNAYE